MSKINLKLLNVLGHYSLWWVCIFSLKVSRFDLFMIFVNIPFYRLSWVLSFGSNILEPKESHALNRHVALILWTTELHFHSLAKSTNAIRIMYYVCMYGVSYTNWANAFQSLSRLRYMLKNSIFGGNIHHLMSIFSD